MSFALDELEQMNTSDPTGKFTGRLEMQRVGVFGYSLGGATALQFCHDDSRCKAGIDVDGAPIGSVVSEGVTQPFLFLMEDMSDSDQEGREIEANIHSIYDRLPGDRRLQIMIRGANHFQFDDDGGMFKVPLVMPVVRLLGVVHLDGRRQIAVTAHCISAFFDAYLKGPGTSQLNISSPLYPEIQPLE